MSFGEGEHGSLHSAQCRVIKDESSPKGLGCFSSIGWGGAEGSIECVNSRPTNRVVLFFRQRFGDGDLVTAVVFSFSGRISFAHSEVCVI